MMQAPVNIIGARAVEFERDLLDLSWTPWRRVWLSSREPLWTLVDADDFDWLSQWQWNVWHAGRGKECFLYAKRNTGERRDTVRMHRELQIRNEPRDSEFVAAHVVDHVNGQTLDNRRANRRWSTKRDNSINRRTRGTAPSLDQILADLLAGLPARPQLEEIPF
ncbi:HNH endonuclease [Bradyrhizobium ottawaense]|uniref:HNH endonuclease n=1 Tax=Bradyrhizobium ottawaense TaxID=931866 RepID=UPI002714E4F4|nr:HNH endonuclease [Bradyrhizobium ottawaense]WLB43041.1 HNH endonuclease [Bradyrhizobium ottawaense]